MKPKHLTIDPELHRVIKHYCFCNNLTVRKFVEGRLNTQDIKEFASNIKKYVKLKS